MNSVIIKVGSTIVGAAVTFVVSSAGRTLGGFIYDGVRDIFGSKEEEDLSTPRKEVVK